jgi:hypothetical protein
LGGGVAASIAGLGGGATTSIAGLGGGVTASIASLGGGVTASMAGLGGGITPAGFAGLPGGSGSPTSAEPSATMISMLPLLDEDASWVDSWMASGNAPFIALPTRASGKIDALRSGSLAGG